MSGFADIEVEAGSDFLKLTAGETVTFHILSPTPAKSVVHWINKKKTNCLGKDCEYCADRDKAKQRWSCKVWDRKDKSVKTFEFGPSIAGQLKAIAEMLAESQQTVHNVDIRVKTMGSGLDTEYSVLHVPMNGEIPQEVTDQYSVPF